MFTMYDLDGNGFLSKDEFFTMMRYGVGPSSPETSWYFKQENRSGQRRVGEEVMWPSALRGGLGTAS